MTINNNDPDEVSDEELRELLGLEGYHALRNDMRLIELFQRLLEPGFKINPELDLNGLTSWANTPRKAPGYAKREYSDDELVAIIHRYNEEIMGLGVKGYTFKSDAPTAPVKRRRRRKA